MAEKVSYRIVVSGWVQGVGFRFYAERLARQCGLAGYVRNLASGKVEVEVEGAHELVERFIEAVKEGPKSAQVSGIETYPNPEIKNYSSFEIRY